MSRYFAVKNFDTFQHYSDRSPPWIKFYNAVLDDYEFTRLPDASRAHLMSIWLLASRTKNRIPFDAIWVAQAIKATTAVDLDALVDAGFLVAEPIATKSVARRKRDASTPLDQRREEGETEQSRGEQKDSAPVGAVGVTKPDFKSEFEAWWQAYPKKVSKGQGYRAYLTARKTTSAADLLAGVLRYVRDVAGTEAKFIRNPATWLNGQGWLDESVTDAAERERENFKREIEERLDAA